MWVGGVGGHFPQRPRALVLRFRKILDMFGGDAGMDGGCRKNITVRDMPKNSN